MARHQKKGTFINGKPCPLGHIGERYVAGGACAQCTKTRAAERYASKRQELLEQARARYRGDPDRYKRLVLERRQREPQKVSAEKRAEYERHRKSYVERAAKWSRNNRQRAKENHRQWRAKNADKVLHYSKLTHAERLKRRPPWLTPEHKKEIRRFYSAARQLTAKTGIKHSVDHIVPLRGETVSGLHVPWNLQILTVADNRAKSNAFAP